MKTESNVGKWKNWNVGPIGSYGEVTTYVMGASFLADCKTICDFGAGRGYMSTLVESERYRGVDGSESSHPAVEQSDLVTYRTEVEGVFIRHVLEHNWEWKKVLANAVASAQKKLCIVLFTPWAKGESVDIAFDHPEIDVPDMSFNREEFMGLLKAPRLKVKTVENLVTNTLFKVEHVIYVTKG